MTQQLLTWLSDADYRFPELDLAWDEPNGLLAAGGDLSTARLLVAYQNGIFPWFNENEPILWWSPDPRCVIRPSEVKVSRSLEKAIKKHKFKITIDQAFKQVISACAAPRKALPPGQSGTWISEEMQAAYIELHRLGYAHSVECWHGDKLAGGLYGLALGKVFFGESMFSRETDASKVAFATFSQRLKDAGFELIDGQVYSAHLASLGFKLLPRKDFSYLLRKFCNEPYKTSFNP